MAVILKEKELSQASAWIDKCKQLMNALYDLEVLRGRILAGAATFNDADLATDPRTHHATVAQLIASFGTVSDLLVYMRTTDGARIASIEVVLRD